MNNSRLVTLALIAGSVAIVVLGWFLAVSPTLDQAAATTAQRDSAAASNVALEARTAALKEQFANLSTLEDQLAPLSASIPFNGDLSSFLDRINAVCARVGVALDSLVVGSAAIVAEGVEVDGAVAADPVDPAVPADTTEVIPAAPDVSTGLVSIPVTIAVSGSYTQTLAFVAAIQTDSRLFVISSVDVTGLPDGTPFRGTLNGLIFALPSTAPVP